jgi:hypothetical protein
MEILRQVVSFIVGLLMLLLGLFGPCTHVGYIVLGLLLMGIFTIPEVMKLFYPRRVSDGINEGEDE